MQGGILFMDDRCLSGDDDQVGQPRQPPGGLGDGRLVLGHGFGHGHLGAQPFQARPGWRQVLVTGPLLRGRLGDKEHRHPAAGLEGAHLDDAGAGACQFDSAVQVTAADSVGHDLQGRHVVGFLVGADDRVLATGGQGKAGQHVYLQQAPGVDLEQAIHPGTQVDPTTGGPGREQ